MVIAGQEQKCSAFASGIRKERVTIPLGTASAISFLFPQKWVLEGVLSTAGASYDWARKALKGKKFLNHLLKSLAGSLSFFPSFRRLLLPFGEKMWKEVS